MPRQLRVEYPGAVGQVMSRRERREDILLDDVARHDLLKTLAEACPKTGWQVQAYCLMRNPDPVVGETPNAFWAGGMAWRQSGCTIRSNHRHQQNPRVNPSLGRLGHCPQPGGTARVRGDRRSPDPNGFRWKLGNRELTLAMTHKQQNK